MKNHFCGQGFIVPSGVLKINPSRLRPCARTLVVMFPFLYDAIPAFMYICGIVSFSLSFKVTLGIFPFLVGALDVILVASLGVLVNVFKPVDHVVVDVDVCLTLVVDSVDVCKRCVLLVVESVVVNSCDSCSSTFDASDNVVISSSISCFL